MKLADSDSRWGKSLGKLIHQDEGENKSGNQPETKLEKRIRQWFTAEEQGEPLLIIRELGGTRYKILVITSLRAILFEAGCFNRLQDISDKVWRQFVSVHLTEGYFCSTLALRFFRYHDSLFYHNPYKDTSPYMEETDFKIDIWKLERLSKSEAQQIYSFLKDKELFWKEKRRQEYFEQLNSLNSKPPGGSPPKKG